MNTQLPLNIQLPEGISFANYYAAANQEVVHVMEQCLDGTGESVLFLWGTSGIGKSHLLQAACHRVAEQKQATAYIPLSQYTEFTVDIFKGLEAMSLVCVDDVQSIAGNEQWEQALFHFYNRMRDAGKSLMMTADKNPASIPIRLRDLTSRLTWGVVIQLHTLSDEQKLAALQLRASQRGFDFPQEVGRFLLARFPRDMHALFGLLDQLDQASLAQQRKLTIPFVKEMLGR